MSDHVLIDQADDRDYVDETYTEEQAAQVASANLIPRGTYRGQVQPDSRIDTVVTEDDKNPFNGKKVAKLHVLLYTDDEQVRHLYLDACAQPVSFETSSGGVFMSRTSQNGALLYRVTKLYGHPLSEVIRTMTQKMYRFTIGIKKANEEKGYEASNIVRNIVPDTSSSPEVYVSI